MYTVYFKNGTVKTVTEKELYRINLNTISHYVERKVL